MKEKLKLGITTFAEVMPNPTTQKTISYDERIRQVVDEIVLADQVGLDYFGVGEHHRKDFAASAPHMILAAAAPLTQQIKLASAVTVLSSDDPVRVYQNFATLNALSHGRAEIMAGRGSFIESFPLFGYDLEDYDELFSEKLEMLIKIRDHEYLTHQGQFTPHIEHLGVYPRTEKPLSISIGVGGTPASVIRAATYGLPLVLAIIGGNPLMFKPLIDLYKKHYIKHGHPIDQMMISIHSHGYIDTNHEQAVKDYFPSMSQAMNIIGKERGWSTYTKDTYDQSRSMQGALYVGDPKYVAKKIKHLVENLEINRFVLHVPVGYMDHEKVLNTIHLLGTEVNHLLNGA